MKQHLYEPTLFLRDGKEWIKGFTMERPDVLTYSRKEYEISVDNFLMSAVEYPVCEGSKKDVRSFLSDKYTNAPWCWPESYIGHEIKVRGMRIDELADRLEVFEIGVLHREKQIRLRPEVKEETKQQDRLLSDLISMLGIPNNSVKESYRSQVLEVFTIKRNK